MEAKVATCLHPSALQWASGEPVPLVEAKWQHQVGYWKPEPVKHEIKRQRGGAGDKRVGPEVTGIWRPILQPSSVPPVAEGQLTSTR